MYSDCLILQNRLRDPIVVEKLKNQVVLRVRSMNDRVYRVLITNILS